MKIFSRRPGIDGAMPSSQNLRMEGSAPSLPWRVFRLAVAAALALVFAMTVSPSNAIAAPAPIRVVVWDDRQPDQAKAYDNFLGNAIADFLAKQPGLDVKSVGMDDPDQGLSKGTLDHCDVLVWWAHRRHAEVKTETAREIVARIQAGKLSLIALHSAHWSKPFVEAMNARSIDDALKTVPEADRAKIKVETILPKSGAPKDGDPLTPSWERVKAADGIDTLRVHLPMCVFPNWRADGKPGHFTTLLPDHPIAKGIPAKFDVDATEMYNEPFHVPAPDVVVFEERWDMGEHFRSGSVWQVGKGKVFYFRPGHETYPVFKQELPLKIVGNAVRWMGAKP